MRYSHLFGKTRKTAPHDADSANARLLVQGGFVDQTMAGVYSWLPLGLRVLRKVENIVREEMNAIGGQELLLPALQPKENWQKTGRWDKVDVLFKLKSQTGKEYALGPTHEEIITPLVGAFVQSYKDLPVALFQIQTKFRDELRAKSGVLRGREFGMKDLYSFHRNVEELNAYYPTVMRAYNEIFTRCGLDIRVTEASGGTFTKKRSHEFHVLTEAGEDRLVLCSSCSFAENEEIAKVAIKDPCPQCGGKLLGLKGIEAGNIFDLGTFFSDAFDLAFTDAEGARRRVVMGCYGLGTTRLVGALVEANYDERGIRWPKSVAPYDAHLVSLAGKKGTAVADAAEQLTRELEARGVEVLWDDRPEVSAGEKFADADLIGIPLRLVISEKTLAKESVEWKQRTADETHLEPLTAVAEKTVSWLNR
ncbi:proline--tRNA ligase [Patescibacteria group bacterium]|nr:MAG: proline--tRNA ligase [Patescibacteria group bacterium]